MSDDQNAVTIVPGNEQPGGRAIWIVRRDGEPDEAFDTETAANARKVDIEAAAAAPLAGPQQAERLACAPLPPIAAEKLRKALARGGVIVVGDGEHVIEAFEPIAFSLSELQPFGAGQLVYAGEFELSSLGMARAQPIAGFGIARRAGAPVLAYCELGSGTLNLAPGSRAKFPRGSAVFSTARDKK